MMQCQNCGNQEGPWVYTEGGPIPINKGLLCEDCYEFFDAVERTTRVMKKRYEKNHNVLDTVAYMDMFENKVYDLLGLK